MSIYHRLPPELWSIVGDFINCTVENQDGSVKLTRKPMQYYTIFFEQGTNEISHIEECSVQ